MAQFSLSRDTIPMFFLSLPRNPTAYLFILFRIFLFTYCPACRILFSISSNYFVSLYVHLRCSTVCFPYFLSLSSVFPPPFHVERRDDGNDYSKRRKLPETYDCFPRRICLALHYFLWIPTWIFSRKNSLVKKGATLYEYERLALRFMLRRYETLISHRLQRISL